MRADTGVVILECKGIVYKGSKQKYYRIFCITYIQRKMRALYMARLVNRGELLKMLQSRNIIFLNAKLSSCGRVISKDISQFKIDIDTVMKCANSVRVLMERNYGTGTDLCGHCIEASELLVSILQYLGFTGAKTVEGWCEFDNELCGSDRPYDPHTWVEVCGNYVDVTADQFNTCMWEENEYPSVIVETHLPHGMRYDEPDINEWQ